jgi:hypothetical protein
MNVQTQQIITFAETWYQIKGAIPMSESGMAVAF